MRAFFFYRRICGKLGKLIKGQDRAHFVFGKRVLDKVRLLKQFEQGQELKIVSNGC